MLLFTPNRKVEITSSPTIEYMETIELSKCSICGEVFERDVNRVGGRLISCPAHSFGEVRPEDYELSPN